MAFSRPDALATKLAGPTAWKIQKAATERYLTGIGKHVAETTQRRVFRSRPRRSKVDGDPSVARGERGPVGSGGMAVAIPPGFLRSEAMLDNFGVTEASWRVTPTVHFRMSETPAYVARAVARIAADPERGR